MIFYLPKWLWASFVALCGFYFFNLSYKVDVLYILQAIMTLAAAYLFFKRRYFLLAVALLAIMIGDLCYYVQFYKLQSDANNLFFYLTTSFLYSSGFALISIFIYERIKATLQLFIKYKLSIIPVFILLGASASFMLSPLYNASLSGKFNYSSLAAITELSMQLPLVILSYFAVILTEDIADACLAIGVLLIGLVDWGIQAEFLTQGALAFSYYDFFWFFGLLLVFSRAIDPRPFQTFTLPRATSLRIQLKILILVSCLLPVGTYYFLTRGDMHLSVGFFLIGSALSLLLASIVVQYFTRQLKHLTSEIEQIFKSGNIQKTEDSPEKISDEWEESLKLVLKNKLYQDRFSAENERIALEKRAELSAQVSHDIRSPLSALNVALSNIKNMPEENRTLMRNAVNRINDIANTLLIQTNRTQHSNESDLTQTVLLSPLIDSLVSEKRTQYRDKRDAEINADIYNDYGIFVNVNPNNLKRAISNLVNNAIEALPNGIGKVTVAIRKYGDKISILIQDNGLGIPESILNKLGAAGISYGKAGTNSGNGLGIYHAKKTIEDARGTFQIISREGVGTTVAITLAKSQAPSWFIESLELSPNMTIISLDDDISIHQIWKGRFASKNISTANIEYKSFTSGSSFRAWAVSNANIDNDNRKLYLIDYELINERESGLDIIEELNIGTDSILVTSRYEEDKIREHCAILNIKLIPKTMAGFVPINIKKSGG